MGHCVESGYGLVDEAGRVAFLDTKAAPLVVGLLREAGQGRGLRIRAEREMVDEEMRTVKVEITP